MPATERRGTVIDVPARPDGVELIGEMEGSGYRTPPSLVRRADGQTLQVTPLLYALLEAIDGHRGYPELAEHVASRTGRRVTPADVQTLVDRQLRPMGLALRPDGTVAELKRSNPLTGLRFKLAVTDPTLTRRLTDPFTVLFHPLVWIPLVAVFGWLAWWLLMERGLAAATYQAFAKPDLLVLVLAVTLLSAGFHEFGHAAAARRGGAQPGVMGAGLFLLWPAFYTDVTDSYRLGRGGRIRTDLGGLYFNAIVAVAIAVIWWVSGFDALLLVVVAQILQMVRQLTPLVRFDGYHVLADVTGVPDLFGRIGPILRSFIPGRPKDPRVTDLKGWVRVVVTAWVLVVVPVLLFVLATMVVAAPRLIGTAIEAIQRERAQAVLHWDTGRYLEAIGSGLGMVVVALPILLMAVIVGRVLLALVRWLARWSAGHIGRRAGAGALVVAMAGLLIAAWWPSPERYRPVRPFEGGTLAHFVMPAEPGTGQAAGRPNRGGGEVRTVLPNTGPLPTEAEPRLAVVLVPTDGSTAEPAWVFPFDKPLPPDAGDNQALAVNTTDGGTEYEVALAWVWVTGDDQVLNTNEAYAFASCADCVTVAVAFQVVVIVGSAEVVVPQNLAAAVNYECFACITAAIANQLVVTVESLPGAEQQLALSAVWDELTAFAESIPTMPLADVLARLDEYERQILAVLGIVGPEGSPAPSGSPWPSGSAGPSGSVVPSGSPSASASPSGSAAPSGSPAPSGSAGAAPSPSAAPVATPAPSRAPGMTPAPSPSASAAPSASASPGAPGEPSSSPVPSSTGP